VRRTVVLDVVGLSGGLLGEHTPNLEALAKRGGRRTLGTVLPAVTCSAQSTFLTGLLPREHGVVGNGWYHRDLAEILWWKQSNHLVGGEKLWEAAKKSDPAFTCAQLFWWFNMYSAADVSVTPRPIYWADGLKLPDFYTHPKGLHEELRGRLGDFPLFDFWGPRAGIKSTEWIARCARHVYDTRKPTLTLVYLPHLDYDLQRLGPRDPKIAAQLRAVDAVAGELIEHVEKDGARVVVLSEYGITEVSGAVDLNRALRRAGLLEVREERGLEKLDAGASEAFAVVDHQIAHVYVRRPERVAEVRRLVEGLEGVAEVLGDDEKRAAGLDHPRAGELVAVARADRWFTYYYWLDDERAPEWARTVDIHRKPGYDPVELFTDSSMAKVAWVLLKKAAGFRYLMDVIPLDAGLVRGSHGRLPASAEESPILLSNDALPDGNAMAAIEVKDFLLSQLRSPQQRQ
jgi:predicted AlkP superfamily pyrophosphatase or phosphodiesterase